MWAASQRRFIIGTGSALMLCAVTAPAGPPLITDDPDTPGPNHWEINVAITAENSEHEWNLETPLLDINYGVGENLQLKYEVSWVVLVPEDPDALSSLGNSLLGVKWHFLHQESAWLDVSVYPQIELNHPTSSVERGLVDDGTSVLLPVQIAHKFSEVEMYADGGYIWHEKGASEGFYGVAVEYEVTDDFSLDGELHSDFERSFENNSLVFNLGFELDLTPRGTLIGSAGRALVETPEGGPEFLGYLGLQITF